MAHRRIGVVTTSFPRWRGDPSGSFVLGLAAAFARRGHEVEVLAPEPRERSDWSAGAAWLRGVRVHAVPYARPRRLEALFYGAGVPDNVAKNPALALLAPSAVAAIFAAVKARAPSWDIVVSEWLLPSALAVASLGARRPAHFAIAHSGDVHLLGRLPFSSRIAAHIAGGAERVGFVADVLRREFSGILGEKCAAPLREKLVLAPMGVDPGCFSNAHPREEIRARLGLRGCAVLFLGRLVPIKGADVLIDAVARSEGTTLVVAGDGPQRGELERRASERGIDARFLGSVDERRRAELFAACDIVAIPSRTLGDGRHEGLPMVAVEAMCAGIPVVAAASGGLAEIVRDGETGLLVPPEDPGALAEAFARLRAEPALRAAAIANGRDVAALRSWDAVVQMILGLSPAVSRNYTSPVDKQLKMSAC